MARLDPGYYDPYDPPPHAPLPGRSRSRSHVRSSRSKSKARDQSRTRKRWPPQPFVEDEKDSLARELNPTFVDYDEVPNRGTVDQDPILIDVPQDTRFVLVPTTDKPPASRPTPPTSDDERARRRGRREGPPKLETAALPEMHREASPYAWTKSALPSHTSGLTASPRPITPPTSRPDPAARRSATGASQSDWGELDRRAQKKAATDSSSARPLSQPLYETRGTAGDDQWPDDLPSRRTPSRYSWTKPDIDNTPAPHSSPTTPFQAPAPASEPPRRRPGSSEGLPNEYARRPAPPKVASLQQSERQPSRSHHSSDSSQDSRDYSTPPPRSPKSSTDRLRDHLPPSIPNSRPSSRGGSTHSSPQASPHMAHSSSDYPWGPMSVAAAAAAPRRSQPPSRLSSSTYPMPSASASSPNLTSLPYPDDDRIHQAMPSERHHQYHLDQQGGVLPPPSEPVSRAHTPKRPSLSTRTSAVDETPTSAGAPRSARLEKSNSANTTKVPPGPALPSCPRSTYSTRHRDWLTLEGCYNFDMCPGCFEQVFEKTSFRSLFKSSPPRPYNMPLRCDFSDPWLRLAWLLTLQRQIPNLSLLVSVANVSETEEPCPGTEKGVRNWYSVRDHDGHFLRGFTVCPQDVGRLEILLPGFRGLFVPLPMRLSSAEDLESVRRLCSLRPAYNSRYPVFLDCLIATHEASVSTHRLPDPHAFISLVRQRTMVPECTRDDLVRGGYWYYIPTLLPALTVCPDCFEEVVAPHLRSDSDVAMRFNSSMQQIRGESKLGSSCQLYSQRMRRVFRHAVQDNDYRYLARKAKDRKEVEDGLQNRVADIRRQAEKLKGRSGYASSTKAQEELDNLQDELETIAEEWTRWE